MGNTIELEAADGHRLAAYLQEPQGKPHGAIVVLQEIFGVTSHIRAIADQYAAAGFLAIAPALFDRVARDVDVPYTDVAQGFGYKQRLNNDLVMQDVHAAIDRVAPAGRVGVVGYCWGGAMAYLAAARLPLAAAVVYYGGGTAGLLAEKPRCPIMFHHGELDAHIPASQVDEIKAAIPAGIFHLYKADHGFNCTDRASYEPASAKLALQRSLEFFHRHLG
ncbi:MAG TPA: dienelactone hydrolase family protein [Steroidobacteraceae bacterium]|nr:dienelactone hydrolase family protein [Steroidobacteraceae bacterium]